MEEQKKSRRGGRREGAGRPRTGSKVYTFRVTDVLAQQIEAQPNKTEFIKACIEQALERASGPDFSRLGEVMPATRVRPVTLPFFGQGLVAGFPIPLDNDERAQDIDLLRMLCPYPESSYLIRVEGNSMIDAGIYSGDIVIVDKSRRQPSETEVAVCELNGEYTLKRFVKRGHEGWLVPANPAYPEIPVTSEDNFSIWGTVSYVIHKPRN